MGGQVQEGWEEAGMIQIALVSLKRKASSSGGRAGRSGLQQTPPSPTKCL